MNFNKPTLVLNESLIGRVFLEGARQVLWETVTVSMKYGYKLGTLFACFGMLWDWRIHEIVDINNMLMAFLLGMSCGCFICVICVLVGRQLTISTNRLSLLDGTPRIPIISWNWDEVSSLHYTEGPKEWTTIEPIVAEKKCQRTIRLGVKCNDSELELLREIQECPGVVDQCPRP